MNRRVLGAAALLLCTACPKDKPPPPDTKPVASVSSASRRDAEGYGTRTARLRVPSPRRLISTASALRIPAWPRWSESCTPPRSLPGRSDWTAGLFPGARARRPTRRRPRRAACRACGCGCVRRRARGGDAGHVGRRHRRIGRPGQLGHAWRRLGRCGECEQNHRAGKQKRSNEKPPLSQAEPADCIALPPAALRCVPLHLSPSRARLDLEQIRRSQLGYRHNDFRDPPRGVILGCNSAPRA